MPVRIIGIRHHSPACARLVAHVIHTQKPAAVLIEGPGDFNARLDELRLEHTLPIALYSYANTAEGAAQSWFPFVEYSPEWVALRKGSDVGAMVRFIDLPHWRYRARPNAKTVERHILRSLADDGTKRSRYGETIARLCEKFSCDGDNALWDHLFESLPSNAYTELQTRLDIYFHELRSDSGASADELAGDADDQHDIEREKCMSHWVAWANQQVGDGLVLVVCGGWHKRAIENLWPTLTTIDEPTSVSPDNDREAGTYLIPFEYRQLDALGGYWSGMQSPLFYQWVWEHGLVRAGEHAAEAIVRQLRRKKIPFSTADFVAFQSMMMGLAHLRNHHAPLRVDILDALQSAAIKEALDAPPPWIEQQILTSQDHPVLREALITLTGDMCGRLHVDTPLPPLLHSVTMQLDMSGIVLLSTPQTIILDRRRKEDSTKAEMLWQLQLIGASGIQLSTMRAPNASRSLATELQFEEHWILVKDSRWLPSLIEAAVFGATLETAARTKLLESLTTTAAPLDTALIAQCMTQAIRAGFFDLGTQLAQQLQQNIHQLHDHAALAKAAHVLLTVAQAGFWGADTRDTMEAVLSVIADRIMWLLEGHQANQPAMIVGDVSAIRVLEGMIRLSRAKPITNFDVAFSLETLLRFARSSVKPPALRGAALGVCHLNVDLFVDQSNALQTDELVMIARAVPARDAFGDFLYGLFAIARNVMTESDDIARAIHAALSNMSNEDFLVALPQLRGAFGWFPPRERGYIAALIAKILGLNATEKTRLTALPQGETLLIDAKRIEAQALIWAEAYDIEEIR